MGLVSGTWQLQGHRQTDRQNYGFAIYVRATVMAILG